MFGTIVFAFLLGSPLHALGPSAPPPALADARAEAEQLVRQGIELRRAGKDEQALEVFRKAQSLRSTPRALAQLGMAEQALGRWVAAYRDLTAALRAGDDAWVAKNRRVLERAADSVSEHLGKVMILGSPSGAAVLINGQRAGALPLSEPCVVPAGDVVVTVEAPGYSALSRKINVAARATARETIELPPETAPLVSGGPAPSRGDAPGPRAPASVASAVAAPPPPEAPANHATEVLAERERDAPRSEPGSTWTWQRSAGIGLLAVAVASLTFGIVKNVDREGKADRFRLEGCGTSDLSIGDCRDRYDQVQSAQKWMIAGYVAAALTGAAGASFLVLSPAAATTTAASAGRATVTAQAGFTIGLGGRF